MIRKLIQFAAFIVSMPALAAAAEARFMTNPDILGDKIVFTYDNDLWLTNVDGGTPVRLTDQPVLKFCAKFSPDGSKIAFF